MIVLATPAIPVTVVFLMIAVACIGFLLDALKTIRENRQELAKKDLQIARLTAKEEPPVRDNPGLTPELVSEAVRFNGYIPSNGNGFVEFMVQGERYNISTDRIPYVVISKWYSINKEKYDIDLFRQAAAKVADQILMGKVFISEDGSDLSFHIESFENKYEHLKDALVSYIDVINELQRRFGRRYDELKAEQERQQKAILGPFVQGERPEGKIMS